MALKNQSSKKTAFKTMSSMSCVLQCGGLCNAASDAFTSDKHWENLKKNALLWSGLDKFGEIYKTVDWENGPSGKYIHDSCRLTICNCKKLEQAKTRQEKRELDECQSDSSSMLEVSPPSTSQPTKNQQ